jgi:hypothetical protein
VSIRNCAHQPRIGYRKTDERLFEIHERGDGFDRQRHRDLLFELLERSELVRYQEFRISGADNPSERIQLFFAKDDWKLHRNLTLNVGVRWDYFGVPWEANGMTAGLVGGASAAFGYSGRSSAD